MSTPPPVEPATFEDALAELETILQQLEDGSTAEVLEPSRDGLYVKIRYLESPFSAEVVGTEGLASEDEITNIRNP